MHFRFLATCNSLLVIFDRKSIKWRPRNHVEGPSLNEQARTTAKEADRTRETPGGSRVAEEEQGRPEGNGVRRGSPQTPRQVREEARGRRRAGSGPCGKPRADAQAPETQGLRESPHGREDRDPGREPPDSQGLEGGIRRRRSRELGEVSPDDGAGSSGPVHTLRIPMRPSRSSFLPSCGLGIALGIVIGSLLLSSGAAGEESRPRARDLGIVVGLFPPGPWNAITDVEGVRVGHETLVIGDDVRTGATAIVPRWGSCSSKGRLSFHYKLILLPRRLARYVVVHELCHLREMNHSPRFWALVEQSLPEYQALRRELKRW